MSHSMSWTSCQAYKIIRNRDFDKLIEKPAKSSSCGIWVSDIFLHKGNYYGEDFLSSLDMIASCFTMVWNAAIET